MQLGCKVVGERLQPVQFVLVFFRFQALAVGDIGADDADAVDVSAHYALLLVGEFGDAEGRVFDDVRAEDGDAVIGFLAAVDGVVAGFFQCVVGEFGILLLGFLQAEHIGFFGGDPFQHVRQADIERVDVPGGEFHGGNVFWKTMSGCQFITDFSRFRFCRQTGDAIVFSAPLLR